LLPLLRTYYLFAELFSFYLLPTLFLAR
jgi:hypothetical protein